MSARVVTELAECGDCTFRDERPGARGRGAQHATRTGHQVETAKRTIYVRAGAPPGAEPFPELGADGGLAEGFYGRVEGAPSRAVAPSLEDLDRARRSADLRRAALWTRP